MSNCLHPPIFKGGFNETIRMGYIFDWYDGPLIFFAHTADKTYLVFLMDENIQQKTMDYMLIKIKKHEIPHFFNRSIHILSKPSEMHLDKSIEREKGAWLFTVDINDVVVSQKWITPETAHKMLK